MAAAVGQDRASHRLEEPRASLRLDPRNVRWITRRRTRVRHWGAEGYRPDIDNGEA